MKTYELQRTKIKVNRDTWRRTLVNLFARDKTIELQQKIINQQSADLLDCFVSSRQAGWQEDKHVEQARYHGREEALAELRSLGENGVSGVRLADMVHCALMRKDALKKLKGEPLASYPWHENVPPKYSQPIDGTMKQWAGKKGERK